MRKFVVCIFGVAVALWALSHMIVFQFGLVQVNVPSAELRNGYYSFIDSSLESLGTIIYDTMPLGRVEYIFSGQLRGSRLAVFRSFALWEDDLGNYPPTVLQFAFKLGGLNVLGVLLVLLVRQRRPVQGAWVEFVGRKRSFVKLWFPALVVGAITIVVSNLARMLWMRVHLIHRAETDVREQYISQGESYTRVDMVSWTPMALGTIPIAAVAIGGIALYFVVISLLFDRMADRGAIKIGLCRKCGYHRDRDGALICPECGFDGTSFKSRSRRSKYLLCFAVCALLLAAPLWTGWFAQYMHQGLYLYFAS